VRTLNVVVSMPELLIRQPEAVARIVSLSISR
jgi:hypothetical protein